MIVQVLVLDYNPVHLLNMGLNGVNSLLLANRITFVIFLKLNMGLNGVNNLLLAN